MKAEQEAKLANPETITIREADRTKYEGLNAEQAAKVASEVFPAVIGEPAGGLPVLAAGESVTGYPSDSSAEVDLGEGGRGVVDSMEPLAVEASPGHREALDLGLDEVGGVFQAVRSDVALRIAKQLAGGVQLAGTGVSLTPVDASGSPLGGSEGVVDGATVLYANTQTDTDTIIKPLALGFDEATLLRSVESPVQLYFRLGVPEGASVVQAPGASGAVKVVQYGQTIASIQPPSALDAAGTQVPVQMTVSRDTLAVSVDDRSGEYQLPILVDPTVIDEEINVDTNWQSVQSTPGFTYYFGGPPWEMYTGSEFTVGEWGSMAVSHAGEVPYYSVYADTSAADPSSIENHLGIC